MFVPLRFKEKLCEKIRVELGSIKNMTPKLRDSIIDILHECYDSSEDELNEELELSEKMSSLWACIHWCAAVADDENNPQLYYDLLNNMSKWHPCSQVCRPHMIQNLKRCDPYRYKSKFRHSVDFHNLVNTQLGKSHLSLEEAEYLYRLKCGGCTFDPNAKGSPHEVKSSGKSNNHTAYQQSWTQENPRSFQQVQHYNQYYIRK
jgi:hypothetical protein